MAGGGRGPRGDVDWFGGGPRDLSGRLARHPDVAGFHRVVARPLARVVARPVGGTRKPLWHKRIQLRNGRSRRGRVLGLTARARP
ncbi:hypothetical protein LV78_002009 [Actinosynnema pretiosum]|nr:hypothetical protein [Actinosynnema pretiosum]